MAVVRKYGVWGLSLVSTLFFVLLVYQTGRTDHTALFLYFATLVTLWLVLSKLLQQRSWLWVFSIGLLFRLSLISAQPHLSDDYFRFVWDGELLKDGYSVFAFVPAAYADHVQPEHQEKYATLLVANTADFPEGMNSKGYHSIYPAVNQFVFRIAAFGNNPIGINIVLIRVFILIAEVCSFFLLRSLLLATNQSRLLGLYWLHPLVIIELTGNIHFEAIAITFILSTLYWANKRSWVATSLSVALGVMTKLTPLLLLGALYKQFAFRKWLLVGALSVVLSCLLFAFYLDLETFSNFKKSVGLFFAWFSFNSGIYYGFRDMVLLLFDTNISAQLSLLFPFVSAAIMLVIMLRSKTDMVTTALLLFTVYFLFTPILHPWYITVLIPLGVLSKKVYPLIWSVLIFGSYMAYGETFEEPLWYIYTEFIVVLLFLVNEFLRASRWTEKISQVIYT